MSSENPKTFEEVFREELGWIDASRGKRLGDDKHFEETKKADGLFEVAKKKELVGLAFSGGGIRSATFNLGILQGLAKAGWLKRFDYLSTVSGGGYIGSWFQAWIQRAGGLDNVVKLLTHEETDSAHGKKHVEADEIHWLRDYSNYLTPRTGWFSADTWHMVAVYLRNMLLNLTVLVLLGTAILTLPRILYVLENSGELAAGGVTMAGVLLLLIGVWFIGQNMRTFHNGRAQAQAGKEKEAFRLAKGIQLRIAFPIVLAAWAGSFWLSRGKIFEGRAWIWPAAGAVTYFLFWFVGWWWGRGERGTSHENFRWGVLLYTALFAGAIGGLGLWGASAILALWKDHPMAVPVCGRCLLGWVCKFTAAFHIGLMGIRFADHYREWWARLGGLLFLWSFGWVGLFGVSLYGPYLIHRLAEMTDAWANSGLIGGWLLSTGIGVWKGSQAAAEEKSPSRLRTMTMSAVPYVFILGLLLVLSNGIHHLIDWLKSSHLENLFGGFFTWLGFVQHVAWISIYGGAVAEWLIIATVIAASLVAALLLARRVDINEFSMHLFYRVRLARAYLGASLGNRSMTAQPFTGFNSGDDIYLKNIQSGDGGPYPIINTTVNYSKGDEMATQMRGGGSFVFTPKYCGYAIPEHGDKEHQHPHDCYQETINYSYPDEGPYLGTAFAISGAAASPAMGYHTSVAWGFLMTVFNVRLGWWTGNPADSAAWKTPGPEGPVDTLKYLFQEITTSTSHKTPYIYLSDGGHFENLGLYELVRRRCRLIVVCAAGGDPKFQFGDLGAAIEKCRVDHGVNIKIDPSGIRPETEDKMGVERSKMHYAVGEINYPDNVRGTLVYIKASVTGDEPADVHNYDVTHKPFPHETTADQWFDERQFESYRALGEHIAKRIFVPVSINLCNEYMRKRDVTEASLELAVLEAGIGAGNNTKMGQEQETLAGQLREQFCQKAKDAGTDFQVPESLKALKASLRAPKEEVE